MFGTRFEGAPIAMWFSPKPCICVRMEQKTAKDFTESAEEIVMMIHHKVYLWDSPRCLAVWGNTQANHFFGDIFSGHSWREFVTAIVEAGGEHADAMAVYMDAMIHSQANDLSLVLSTRAKWLLPAYVHKLGFSAEETLHLCADPVIWQGRRVLLVHYKPMPDHDLHLLPGETARQALHRILELAVNTGRWVRRDIMKLKGMIADGEDLDAPLSMPQALLMIDDEVRRSLLMMLTGKDRVASPVAANLLTQDVFMKAGRRTPMRDRSLEDVFTKWDVDYDELCTKLGDNALTSLGKCWIANQGFEDALPVDGVRLGTYMETIERQYLDVPYHNRRHVFGVLHFMGMLLGQQEVTRMLRESGGESLPIYRFAAFMAAFVHDVGHRGLTNAHLCASLDNVALVHNDNSPNENMHTSTAFLTMFEDGKNFLHTASMRTLRTYRSTIIRLVTLTDMQRHNEVVAKFREHCSAGTMDCLTCLAFLLVCADLGHTAMSWKQHERWVLCLQEEMFRQGDREKSGNHDVSPLCDRSKGGLVRCQVPFFDMVVLPMYSTLYDVCPETVGLLENARNNRQTWSDM